MHIPKRNKEYALATAKLTFMNLESQQQVPHKMGTKL
jgi:hypothetical protein